MKRFIGLLLCFIVLVSSFSTFAFANESTDILLNCTYEYFDNGDYIVTELYENVSQSRGLTKTGTAIATYYNSANTKIWDLRVEGTFTYSYGVSSEATSSTATIVTYTSTAVPKSKNAYTSGNTAYGSGTVNYSASVATMNAHVSCDVYGNLSYN